MPAPTTQPGDDPARQTVTLRMVADRAGVSKSLVSRVLQGAAHVSDRRRSQVEQAIKELGYRPNSAARGLTQRRTNAVGVLINDLRQPWFIDFLEGLNETLHDVGLNAFIGDGRLDRATDEHLLQAFMEMRVDGLVLAGTMPLSDTIRDAVQWTPSVVAGMWDLQADRVDVAAEDDWLAARLALDHLHALGHRRIHHITGEYGKVVEFRRDSYLEWMADHGLADQVAVVPCDTSDEGGYQAARTLLDVPTDRRPTAILAANDLTCAGALGAAWELGIEVPTGLSLVGFDGSPLARMRHLRLTTVDIHSRAVGQNAATMLVERIREPDLPARRYLADPTLSVGTTSGPCPA